MLNEKECLEISRKAELLEKIPFKLRYNSDVKFQCAFYNFKDLQILKRY